VRPIGDQGEDLGDEALLDGSVLSIRVSVLSTLSVIARLWAYQLRVELGQPWLTGVIEDQDSIDHDAGQANIQRKSREAETAFFSPS